jgi:hypothetical protein
MDGELEDVVPLVEFTVPAAFVCGFNIFARVMKVKTNVTAAHRRKCHPSRYVPAE